MFKYFLLFLLIPFFTSSVFIKEPDSSYRVFFIQDTLRYEVAYNDKTLSLKKKPFRIELHMKNLEGVTVHISDERLFYDTPLNKRFKDWEYLSGKTSTEEHNNTDKDILVQRESVCYWFYDGGDYCRMDKGVKVEKGVVIGSVTVKNILELSEDLDHSKDKKYTIGEIDKPLYFVFFYYDLKARNTPDKEYQRKRVKVVFED